jgi:hypothetical protein
MNPLKNIILALSLTLTLGIKDTRFYIKPSVYLMPKVVFTNRANYDRVKKTKVPRNNPPAINIITGDNRLRMHKGFQLRVPLPDLAAVFFKGPGKKNKFESIVRIWDLETGIQTNEKSLQTIDEQLVYNLNR